MNYIHPRVGFIGFVNKSTRFPDAFPGQKKRLGTDLEIHPCIFKHFNISKKYERTYIRQGFDCGR